MITIDLTSREFPNPGEQPGVFADVYKTVKKDKRNREYKYLVLVGELAATKSSGKRFIATTCFNLDDARGIKSLRENLQTWRGSDALPDLNGFVPEKEFLGQSFLAKPTVTDKGGVRQIQFSGFKRYSGDNPIALSPDFVRVTAPSA